MALVPLDTSYDGGNVATLEKMLLSEAATNRIVSTTTNRKMSMVMSSVVGGADYTLTFPNALPATKSVVHISDAGVVTYEVIGQAVPQYADDAARLADGYSGVWRDADGDLFKSGATAGADPYLRDSMGELVQQSAPTTPAVGDVWRDGNLMKFQNAAGTQTLATLNDIANAMNWRGTYAIPAGGTNRPDQNSVSNIQAGDLWIITTGGTIAGIEGADTLEVGDFLIATTDNPTSGAGYAGIQTNTSINLSNVLATQTQTANYTGGVAQTYTFTGFVLIVDAEAYDSTGRKRPTLNLVKTGSNTVSVEGLSNIANLSVVAVGTV